MGVIYLSPKPDRLEAGVEKITYGIHTSSKSRNIQHPYLVLHISNDQLEANGLSSQYVSGLLKDCQATHYYNGTNSIIVLLGAANLIRAIGYINMCIDNHFVNGDTEHNTYTQFFNFYNNVISCQPCLHDENEIVDPVILSCLEKLFVDITLLEGIHKIETAANSRKRIREMTDDNDTDEDDVAVTKAAKILTEALEVTKFLFVTKKDASRALRHNRRDLQKTGDFGLFSREYQDVEDVFNSEPSSDASDISEIDIENDLERARSNSCPL